MYRHWFDKLLARLSTPRPVTSACRRPAARPRIESLENRLLPSINSYYEGRVLHVDIDTQPPFGVPIYLRHFTDKTAVIGAQYEEFFDSTFDSMVIDTTDNLGPITIIDVVKPTTINVLAGHIPVNVGARDEPLDLEAPVSINGQRGTVDVSYNDLSTPSLPNLVYNLSANGNAGRVQRSGFGDVSYSGISSLTLSTSTGRGVGINILGTAVATPTTVYDDAVRTTINVGVPSQVLNLSSPLSVTGDEFASISYNDQANSTPALTYTVSANQVQRNGLADLNFGGSIGTLTVNTGTVGNQTVNVLSTGGFGSTFQVNCGTGNSDINIGTPTTAPSLGDPLSVNVSPSGIGHLSYNDQANPGAALTYTLSNGLVQRNGLADVSYSGIQDLALHTGTVGSQTINVLSTAATPAGTSVYGGQGNDRINVGDPAAALDLRYPLYVDESGGGINTLTYNDQAYRSFLSTYTLSGQGATPAGIVRRNGLADLAYYGINKLTVNIGTYGKDTVNVLGTGTLATTINGSQTDDTINIGDPGTLLALRGPLEVNERGGGTKTLNYNDQANPTPSGLAYALSVSGSNGFVQRNGLAGLTYTGLTNLVVNTAAAGNQSVNVLSTAASSAAAVTVNGGRGQNSFFFGTAGSLAGLTAPVTITHASQLLVDNSADTTNHASVLISSAGITGLAPAALNFTATTVSTLTVRGGSGNNTYAVTGTPAATAMTLNPGAGADTIAVQANSTSLTIDSTAGSGADTVTLGAAPNGLSQIGANVTINAALTDSLVLNDQGFSGARTFTVTDTTVSWGGPTVTYAGLGSLTIQGGSGGTTFVVLASSATAALTLDGQGAADTLAGSDAGNLFAVTGGDSGTLSGSAYANPVTFNQVGNLMAGQGGDSFQFADQATLSGSITGSGLDTLDYTAYTTSVVVDLQTGIATGVGGSVSGILNINGGIGGDPGTYNLLIGAGGNALTGGTGRRNILVAGGSASTLTGGDQDDLLIAGSTAYDTEAGLASWLAIASYWAGGGDYFTRVANLTSGTGVPLLDATTVLGNGGGNVLNGNGELALIFGDGFDFISGFDPNSQTIPINS